MPTERYIPLRRSGAFIGTYRQTDNAFIITSDKGGGKCLFPRLSVCKGLDTCYSAIYVSQSRDQQRFTISEVAADWHEPMVPQRIMWPSIARANGKLDHGAASRHTIVQISHTRPSPRSRSYHSFPIPMRVGG